MVFRCEICGNGAEERLCEACQWEYKSLKEQVKTFPYGFDSEKFPEQSCEEYAKWKDRARRLSRSVSDLENLEYLALIGEIPRAEIWRVFT